IDAEARAKADGTLKTLLEGIDLTGRALLHALSKHGVARIEADGAKFDPNMHQAMFEVPNTEVPSGTVVQVIQPGYKLGERVLRPALVGVSKGGPKAAPTDAPPAGN
ncbi:MAG: nucleotide exchange factor GrpE, partial [Starkeya sp.]|nr:nucleotide exchange factor GrpE [Starkeya sp.]